MSEDFTIDAFFHCFRKIVLTVEGRKGLTQQIYIFFSCTQLKVKHLKLFC